MNLPNKLTTARLLITVGFVAFLSVPDFPHQVSIGFALFLIASLTDFLDGYIARSRNMVTDFGKLMDPLADKILTSAVFVILSAGGVMPAWATILIIAREFLVTGLRLIASAQGKVLAADSLGKWKTISQIVTAAYFLVDMGRDEPLLAPVAGVVAPEGHAGLLGGILLGACVGLTLVSGLSYALKNRSLIRNL